MLPGCLTEWLPGFGRIDTNQLDFMPTPGAVEYSNRVAAAHADNPADEVISQGRQRNGKREDKE